MFHTDQAERRVPGRRRSSLPLSAPVPESFAGPLDKQVADDLRHQVPGRDRPVHDQVRPKTGKFAGIGYQTGKSLTLVRNPNWNPRPTSGPAYLNQINFNIGGDATVIGQQVLKGSNVVQLDTPAQSIVKLAYQQYPSQITFTPGLGRALRGAQQLARAVQERQPAPGAAGPRSTARRSSRPAAARSSAEPATHFIYPGVDGFEQAGGAAGPQVRRGTTTSTATCGGREVHEGGRLPDRQVHRQRDGPDRRRQQRQRPGDHPASSTPT